MILRIIIIFFLIVFYEPIINFLKNNKIENLKNLKNKIKTNTEKIIENVIDKEINKCMGLIKKMDGKSYKKCKILLKKINKIKYKIIKNNNYEINENMIFDIKLYKKIILNEITSLVVSRGFNKHHENIIKSLIKYIDNILSEINEFKKINTDGEVEASDLNSPNFSFNYNIF